MPEIGPGRRSAAFHAARACQRGGDELCPGRAGAPKGEPKISGEITAVDRSHREPRETRRSANCMVTAESAYSPVAAWNFLAKFTAKMGDKKGTGSGPDFLSPIFCQELPCVLLRVLPVQRERLHWIRADLEIGSPRFNSPARG